MNRTRPIYNIHSTVFLGIAVLVGVLYGNTLVNGFIHDDHGQVEQNTFIQSWEYLPKVITGCIWESAVGDCKKTFYYRPMQTLTYMMTYTVSSSPWVFHFMNLVFMTLCVFLIYIMILLLTKNIILSLLTAFLFLIHPINSEVVNWIATVPELLYTIFALLGTICFFLYRQTRAGKYLFGVCLWYVFGIFSKEPAVFLLFIFLTVDIFYFKLKAPNFLKKRTNAPYLICAALFCIYMILRLRVLGGLGWDRTIIVTASQRIFIVFDLLSLYIKALFWPHPLNLYYPYVIPSHLFASGVMSGWIAGCVIIIGLVWSWKKKWKEAVFSLVWFCVFLAPSLIFVNSIGENLYAERHIFASSIGFSFILSLLLSRVWQSKHSGKILVIIVCFLLFFVSYIVIHPRNTLWHDDERLYRYTLTISPTADLVRYNLALLYRDKNDFTRAKEQLGIIVARNSWSGLYKVLNNLGDIARKEKNYDEALKYFKKSIDQNPLHMPAYNNIGALYLEQGNILQSVQTYCKANRIDPSFPPANNNYDMIIRNIQNMDTGAFAQLAAQIEKEFQPAKTNTIVINSFDCSGGKTCQLSLSSSMNQNEILLPFLVSGKNTSGKIIRPLNIAYSPASPAMALSVDQQFKDQSIRFLFPTCEGTYYEAQFYINNL